MRRSAARHVPARKAAQPPWHERPQVDEEATNARLHTLLLGKTGELTSRRPPPGFGDGIGSKTVAHAAVASDHRPNAAGEASSMFKDLLGDAQDLLEGPTSERERERHKAEFLGKACAPNTRVDVQVWAGKIYDMMLKAEESAVLQEKEAEERRRRRMTSRRHSSTGSLSIHSPAGSSGSGSNRALPAAGGSIAASSQRARTPQSLGSLEVHDGEEMGKLSMKELIQAHLAKKIPELEEHINNFVSIKAKALRRQVDEEFAEQFLTATSNRRIFEEQENQLRWRGARHKALQWQLEQSMGDWILDAMRSWDQNTRAAQVEAKNEESLKDDTDLIYSYLTNRSAHINPERLPTEIALVGTLHASYSLPTMWRDKYLA